VQATSSSAEGNNGRQKDALAEAVAAGKQAYGEAVGQRAPSEDPTVA
jgi:hypothetical protein